MLRVLDNYNVHEVDLFINLASGGSRGGLGGRNRLGWSQWPGWGWVSVAGVGVGLSGRGGVGLSGRVGGGSQW